MTVEEAEKLLDLMERRAPSLRAAGIRSVNLGGASFTLAPAELEPDTGDDPEPEEGPSDVLHDRWTYGAPAPGAPTTLPKRGRTPL